MLRIAKIRCYLFCSLLLILLLPYWATAAMAPSQFYLGLLAGYGDTNWGRITTSDGTLQGSLPSSAQDTGLTWGIFAGDNIGTYYGAEVRYQHFTDSTVNFAQYNEYSPAPDFPAFTMKSATESYMLLGKLRIPVKSAIELYSIFGGAYTHRSDLLADVRGFGGVFGGGASYQFTQHISNDLEFDFITGNAAINLEPAKAYLPFLTSLNYKLSYIF